MDTSDDEGRVILWAPGVDPAMVPPEALVKIGPPPKINDKWKRCPKHEGIVCRNTETCFKYKDGEIYCYGDPHEHITETTEIKDMSDFYKGARAFFDALISRTANHWSGRPEANKIMEEENKLITEWAEEALREVSPGDMSTWRDMGDMLNRGKEEGYLRAKREFDAQAKNLETPEEKHRACYRVSLAGLLVSMAAFWGFLYDAKSVADPYHWIFGICSVAWLVSACYFHNRSLPKRA